MTSLDNIALTIKKEISVLENDTKGKKSAIENTYQAALSEALEKKKSDIKKLDDDVAKAKKLKKLYQSYTGEIYSSEANENTAKISEGKKKTNDEKLIEIITILGTASAIEVEDYIKSNDIIFGSSIANALSKLETVKSKLKSEGRPKKYSIV